ncbi:hypothetical protein QYF36_009446 [Acer negundo]|nr:hypothetical protein QYF36_009446 [Acer negundo]
MLKLLSSCTAAGSSCSNAQNRRGSSAGDGGNEGTLIEVDLAEKAESDAAEMKSSSAIVSANPRPDDYLKVG